jgi:hypothetical protein
MLTLTIIALVCCLLVILISIFHIYIIQRYVSIDNRTRILTKIILVFPVKNYFRIFGKFTYISDSCHMLRCWNIGTTYNYANGIVYTNVTAAQWLIVLFFSYFSVTLFTFLQLFEHLFINRSTMVKILTKRNIKIKLNLPPFSCCVCLPELSPNQ